MIQKLLRHEVEKKERGARCANKNRCAGLVGISTLIQSYIGKICTQHKPHANLLICSFKRHELLQIHVLTSRR